MSLKLTIYTYEDPEKPIAITQPYISFEMLGEIERRTSELETEIRVIGDIDNSNIGKLLELMEYMFRGQVDYERLKKYADIDDIFQSFLALGSLSKKYSRKKKTKAETKAFVTGKKS